MNARWELKLVLLGVGLLTLVVNLFVKKEERRRGVAFLLGWALPGAGHVFLGKWRKGLCLLLLMGATYLFGLWIVGFRAVSFDDNPFYYVGQYGSGATFLLARILGAEKAYPRPGIHPSWFDPGLLYICIVGLLNLVVMMNVLDIKLGPVPAKTEETGSSPAPSAPPVPAPSPEKTA
jgi:hypothetical protein